MLSIYTLLLVTSHMHSVVKVCSYHSTTPFFVIPINEMLKRKDLEISICNTGPFFVSRLDSPKGKFSLKTLKKITAPSPPTNSQLKTLPSYLS